jgi:hypothetical protein
MEFMAARAAAGSVASVEAAVFASEALEVVSAAQRSSAARRSEIRTEKEIISFRIQEFSINKETQYCTRRENEAASSRFECTSSRDRDSGLRLRGGWILEDQNEDAGEAARV